MRIVLANCNCRREGGIETYLDTIISALHEAGHDVALCHEINEGAERALIELPKGALSWCAKDLGVDRTIAAVREWHPDVIYSHNLLGVELERRLLDVAPAVFFAHTYQGTCISGSKAFSVPTPRPCSRRFGWGCFLHFYPRRCGGLNPATMLSLYRRQANRLALIKRYKIVLTHSMHMRTEYIRHGLPDDSVLTVPYCVKPLPAIEEDVRSANRTKISTQGEWRLAFAGRMDFLKGGSLLLKTLPLLRSRAGRPLRLRVAGDGPCRQDWEVTASRIRHSSPDINIEFTGWLTEEQLAPLFDSSDVFVMPSLLPEPFGTVGVQAGFRGLPSVAFDVGGIRTWLIDGVNGHLAAGDPPTAEGLVEAIVKCLNDDDHYLNLQKGAAMMARRFSVERHMQDLLKILEAVAHPK